MAASWNTEVDLIWGRQRRARTRAVRVQSIERSPGSQPQVHNAICDYRPVLESRRLTMVSDGLLCSDGPLVSDVLPDSSIPSIGRACGA